MPQQVRRRFQKTVKYSANNQESELLSRGMVYRELKLRLQGQLTCTAGNNTQALTLRGDEWAAVKRVDIVANNTDVIRSIKGADLWWLNFFFYGMAPETVSSIGGGGANPSFDTELVLPFWMPRSIRPIDTALDARELSDLKIVVTWGDYTDINGSATGFTTNPTLEVSSLESFGVKGPFSQFRLFHIEREVTADNPQFQIDLPVGPMYRGFMAYFTDGGSDSGSVLNNWKWISGTTVYADVKEKDLHEEYLIRHGIPRNPSRRGNANDADGIYMYDHVTDGYLSESVDSLGFSELQIELDVTKGTGTTKVVVYPLQVIPVRGGANQ